MTEEIRIPSANRTLAATLRIPEGDGHVGLAILLHGWRSSRQTGRNGALAEALEREGVASLSLDFAGHGESDGDIRQSTVLSQVADALNARRFVLNEYPRIAKNKIGVVGASIGGSTALAAMSPVYDTPHFRCGVLISPRLDFGGVAEDMYCFDGPNGRVENRVMLAEGKATDFYALAAKVEAPTLIIHGTKDEFVSIDQSSKLAAMYPKTFDLCEIKGGDHRLQAHIPQVVRLAVAHLVDYLGPS